MTRVKLRIRDKLVKQAFDRWSTNYHKVVPAKLEARGYSYEKLASISLPLLNLKKEDFILEIGIGSGRLALHMSPNFKFFIGADVSKNMLMIAKKEVTGNFVQCSAEFLPFRNETFDGIYSTFMLHSVIHQKACLAEISRILKPSRKVLIADLCLKNSRLQALTRFIALLHSMRYEYGAPAVYRSTNEYSRMIDNSNLKILKTAQLGVSKKYTHFMFLAESRVKSSDGVFFGE